MRLTGKTCQRGSSTDPVHLKLSSHWRELLLGSHFVVLAVGLIFMRPSEKSFVPKPRCTALGCLFSSDSRPNDQNTKRIPAEVDKPKDTFTIGGMTSFPFSETAIAYSGIYIYILYQVGFCKALLRLVLWDVNMLFPAGAWGSSEGVTIRQEKRCSDWMS